MPTQSEHLLVTGRCHCGCPTVDFTVDPSNARPAGFQGSPLLPVEADTGEGEASMQVILFAPNGWLQSLELVFCTSEPPTDFPAPSEFRLLNLHPQAPDSHQAAESK